MKKYSSFWSLLILVLSACESSNQAETTDTKESVTIISADTIPELRAKVNQKPVASYTEKLEDELNNWQLSVSLYETPKTFQYLVRMQAKEVRVSDSLTIPNFGINPQPEIRKGPEPQTCIIGFLDKQKVFREYKKVRFKDDQLRITTIKKYSVGYYRKSA